MFEKLMAMDPQAIAAWIQLVVVVVGLVLHLRAAWAKQEAEGNLSRWDFIKGSIPEIHEVVQKIAAQTKTQKDDEFVRQVSKLLRAAGLLPVQADEVDAVKALGSGYHQIAKGSVALAAAAAASPPADPRPGPA